MLLIAMAVIASCGAPTPPSSTKPVPTVQATVTPVPTAEEEVVTLLCKDATDPVQTCWLQDGDWIEIGYYDAGRTFRDKCILYTSEGYPPFLEQGVFKYEVMGDSISMEIRLRPGRREPFDIGTLSYPLYYSADPDFKVDGKGLLRLKEYAYLLSCHA